MTENQTLKLYLLQQNTGNLARAKEAYEFIMSGDVVETDNAPTHAKDEPATPKDGVYLRYKDGHEEWFGGSNNKDDIVGITVRLGERRTCIAKFDVKDYDEGNEEFPLLKYSEYDTDDDRKAFVTDYFGAYNDLNGKEHTKTLILRGCKIPLAEGQYIPAIGEWLLVMMFFERVQEALKYACGEMLKSDWYWSSTEHSSNYAWYVSVAYGSIHCNLGRSGPNRVRPCLSCEAI